MKTVSLLFASALCLVINGCGSSQAEPAHAEGEGHEHAEGHKHAEHGEGHEHGKPGEHPEMKGAVKGFHDVLAPAFHMDKGAPRVEKTCGAVASMKEQAKAVAGEAGDDAAKKRAEALTASVDGLDKACAASGRPEVEGSLDKVHEAFHAVMEAK